MPLGEKEEEDTIKETDKGWSTKKTILHHHITTLSKVANHFEDKTFFQTKITKKNSVDLDLAKQMGV